MGSFLFSKAGASKSNYREFGPQFPPLLRALPSSNCSQLDCKAREMMVERRRVWCGVVW
jgi:hypothetical protein